MFPVEDLTLHRDVAARVAGAVVLAVDAEATEERAAVPGAAVEWAVTEARLLGRPLVVLTCVAPRPEPSLPGAPDPREVVRRVVVRAQQWGPSVRTLGLVLPGDVRPWLSVVGSTAARLVLARHADPAPEQRRPPGSTTVRAIGAVSCPLVVVPPLHAPRRGVVVGFDGSAGGWEVARWGAREALVHTEQLLVVHCYRSVLREVRTPARAWFAGVEARTQRVEVEAVTVALARAHPGLPVHGDLLEAESPAATLTVLAGTAALLVVGARGLWDRPDETGWTTRAVLRAAPVPVAVVPVPS